MGSHACNADEHLTYVPQDYHDTMFMSLLHVKVFCFVLQLHRMVDNLLSRCS